jgi:hypothetical protein
MTLTSRRGRPGWVRSNLRRLVPASADLAKGASKSLSSSRHCITKPAVLTLSDGQQVSGTITIFGNSGAFVEVRGPVVLTEFVRVAIPDLWLLTQARVAWQEGQTAGLEMLTAQQASSDPLVS